MSCLLLAISGWVVAAIVGVVAWTLDRKTETVVHEIPEGDTGAGADLPPILPFGHLYLDDGMFRVVQTTPDGRRARMMLERGTPGSGETLTLYDGPHQRGQKQGAVT